MWVNVNNLTDHEYILSGGDQARLITWAGERMDRLSSNSQPLIGRFAYNGGCPVVTSMMHTATAYIVQPGTLKNLSVHLRDSTMRRDFSCNVFNEVRLMVSYLVTIL